MWWSLTLYVSASTCIPCEESKDWSSCGFWAWEGAVAQTNPGRPLRSGKVTWQTTSCWQKRRATLGLFRRDQECQLCALNASIFVQPFNKIFFCYPSKISCLYRQNFLFKIRSQYTWFSLFDYVQKCKKSPFITFLSSRVSPTRLRQPQRLRSTPPRKWSNMQLVFQHGPISRESKNIETILTIWNGYSRK